MSRRPRDVAGAPLGCHWLTAQARVPDAGQGRVRRRPAQRAGLDEVFGEINGVEPIEGAPIRFKSAAEEWVWHNPFTVTGKISQKRKITLEEFAYNRARGT